MTQLFIEERIVSTTIFDLSLLSTERERFTSPTTMHNSPRFERFQHSLLLFPLRPPSPPMDARSPQGFGVHPYLSFSRMPVELPVVPLSVTSRAMFQVTNSGFSDMEVSYRLPQYCPVDLAVAFPEGQQVLRPQTAAP